VLRRAPLDVVVFRRPLGPLLRRVQVDVAHLRRAPLHPRRTVQVEDVRARPRQDVVQGDAGQYAEFGIFGSVRGHLPECVFNFFLFYSLLKLCYSPLHPQR